MEGMPYANRIAPYPIAPSTQTQVCYPPMINLLDPQFHPANNPDVLDALDNKSGYETIHVFVLKSGRLAVFDRMFILLDIRDDSPSLAEIKNYSRESVQNRQNSNTANAFYGEPKIDQWIRDLKTTRRAEHITSPRAPKIVGEILDL